MPVDQVILAKVISAIAEIDSLDGMSGPPGRPVHEILRGWQDDHAQLERMIPLICVNYHKEMREEPIRSVPRHHLAADTRSTVSPTPKWRPFRHFR